MMSNMYPLIPNSLMDMVSDVNAKHAGRTKAKANAGYC